MRKSLFLCGTAAMICMMAAEKSGGSGKAKEPAPEPPTDLEKAEQNIKPNTPPDENENVGRTDLAPAEGQAHSADQREDLAATLNAKEPKLGDDGRTPADLAKMIGDPVFLIEAAIAAANADPLYLRNGPLQTFLRHYSVDQVAIRQMQERLNERQERRDAEQEAAKDREAAEAKARKKAAG